MKSTRLASHKLQITDVVWCH